MQVIEIQTLIDITDTKVSRLSQGSQLEHDQYKNFVTLKQCVELRSNITFDTKPNVEIRDIKDMGFGSKYKGKQAVWTFRFTPDRSGAYAIPNDEVGCLYSDINEVPIIKKLKETINIDKAMFDLTDIATKNTIIKAIQGTI